MLFPALFSSDGPRRLELLRPELLAAVPTFFFAWRTRSLGGTVVVGQVALTGMGGIGKTQLAAEYVFR